MTGPLTKTARQARIVTLLGAHQVRSQHELAELLADGGVQVTQGTLSRDLVEVGALRVRGSGGQLVYAVPGDGGDRSPQLGEFATFEARLVRLCGEVLVSAQASANLVVLRTPPGAAQYFASAVDRVSWPELLGTIAGDDTILLITRDPHGGEAMADRFLTMSARSTENGAGHLTGSPLTASHSTGSHSTGSHKAGPQTTKEAS